MTEQHDAATAGDTLPGRPATDPYRAYITRIVDAAPPLTTEQRAAIRVAFHGQAAARTEAA